MATKDFQEHLREHYRLCALAKECAQKAVDCAEAGDDKSAKKWTKKTAAALADAMEIERKFKLRNPHEDL